MTILQYYAVVDFNKVTDEIIRASKNLSLIDCRKSLDGTKVIVKFEAASGIPAALSGHDIYSESEIVNFLTDNTAEWNTN